MLIQVPNVLTPDQVAHARQVLAQAPWVDGRVTAGPQSARAKQNLQLPEDSPQARELGEMILGALQRNALFMSAALPLKVFPPLFNQRLRRPFVRQSRRQRHPSSHRHAASRADGSPGDVFFVDPDGYEGGELVIEDTYGTHSVKPPAGHLVLYPSTSLHHVRPVTSGARVSSFFWIQSLIRDDGRRALLFDMDTAIQRLAVDVPDHASTVQLTGVYHNLLRQWAEL